MLHCKRTERAELDRPDSKTERHDTNRQLHKKRQIFNALVIKWRKKCMKWHRKRVQARRAGPSGKGAEQQLDLMMNRFGRNENEKSKLRAEFSFYATSRPLRRFGGVAGARERCEINKWNRSFGRDQEQSFLMKKKRTSKVAIRVCVISNSKK